MADDEMLHDAARQNAAPPMMSHQNKLLESLMSIAAPR
tara:strand:- start:622 stop:735 length:114 start_codon:yes stop_codon:yes gene_type:complete